MIMLEDRIRNALADEAAACPEPTITASDQRQGAKPWLVMLAAAAAVFVVIGGAGLLASQTSVSTPTSGSTPASDPPPNPGFSAADAALMEVTTATYSDAQHLWFENTPYPAQGVGAVSEKELTPELIEVVRTAASEALESIEAEPPYSARIITAMDHGVWDALVTTTFAGGQCLVVVDESSIASKTCRTNDSSVQEPILLGGEVMGYTVLPADPSLDVGSWVYGVWWGLPADATGVLYHTTSTAGTESDTNAAAVLDDTVVISHWLQGVDQHLTIEVHGSDDEVIMEDSILIPSFADAGAILTTPASKIVYETDPTAFAGLLNQSDTFIGGGYVNGEPWAIVGRSLVVEGKPTLQCSGVRPILDEDVCGVVDHVWLVGLPVGDTDGGILVVRADDAADAVRVDLADGTSFEAPLVGSSEGYPPVAVVPVESPGISGTVYGITSSGDILSAQPFEVTEFVNPGG